MSQNRFHLTNVLKKLIWANQFAWNIFVQICIMKCVLKAWPMIYLEMYATNTNRWSEAICSLSFVLEVYQTSIHCQCRTTHPHGPPNPPPLTCPAVHFRRTSAPTETLWLSPRAYRSRRVLWVPRRFGPETLCRERWLWSLAGLNHTNSAVSTRPRRDEARSWDL